MVIHNNLSNRSAFLGGGRPIDILPYQIVGSVVDFQVFNGYEGLELDFGQAATLTAASFKRCSRRENYPMRNS